MVVFKERISRLGYIGLLLAAFAVLLMNWHVVFG
jgi:EamA domain-containing membrane protein RarD